MTSLQFLTCSSRWSWWWSCMVLFVEEQIRTRRLEGKVKELNEALRTKHNQTEEVIERASEEHIRAKLIKWGVDRDLMQALKSVNCNTPVLSIAFDTCISWAQASSKNSWTWAYEISYHSYTLSHEMLIYIYIFMLAIMYDQCMRWLWGHENTLDTSRMINGTMFIFMT